MLLNPNIYIAHTFQVDPPAWQHGKVASVDKHSRDSTKQISQVYHLHSYAGPLCDERIETKILKRHEWPFTAIGFEDSGGQRNDFT